MWGVGVCVCVCYFGANRMVEATMRGIHILIGLGYNGCSHVDQVRMFAP